MGRKIETVIDTDKGTMTFAFASGNKAKLDVNKLSDDIKTQGLFHGLKQKVVDAGAGKKDQELEDAINKVLDGLKSNNWNTRVPGTGGSGRVTQLVEAVARIKGYDLAKAKEVVNGLTEEQVKTLKASDTVKATIATMKAEKFAKKQESAEGSDDALDLV